MKIAVLSAFILVNVSTTSLAQEQVNDVRIRISSHGDQLTAANFELSDKLSFNSRDGYWEGHQQSIGYWADHTIILYWGHEDFPLTVRTMWKEPNRTITISHSRVIKCNQNEVSDLVKLAKSAVVEEQIEAIIHARQLLMAPFNVACFKEERELVARIYFDTSCDLQSSSGFFRVSKDARKLYVTSSLHPDTAEARADACGGNDVGKIKKTNVDARF